MPSVRILQFYQVISVIIQIFDVKVCPSRNCEGAYADLQTTNANLSGRLAPPVRTHNFELRPHNFVTDRL